MEKFGSGFLKHLNKLTTVKKFIIHGSDYLIKAGFTQETKPLPPTMHWQNTGLDKQTSAVVRYQLRFGAGLFLRNFLVILNSAFILSFPPGLTSNYSPYFANAKRR